MNAISAEQSLASPPNFQSPETTYYTPANKFQTTADILGAVSNAGQSGLFSPQTIGSVTGSMGSGGSPMMSSVASQSPGNSFYGGTNPSSMQSMGQMDPQTLMQLMALVPK